jgi:multidrug efflux pump subunit AcrB
VNSQEKENSAARKAAREMKVAALTITLSFVLVLVLVVLVVVIGHIHLF